MEEDGLLPMFDFFGLGQARAGPHNQQNESQIENAAASNEDA
jgi:hypothetical protein